MRIKPLERSWSPTRTIHWGLQQGWDDEFPRHRRHTSRPGRRNGYARPGSPGPRPHTASRCGQGSASRSWRARQSSHASSRGAADPNSRHSYASRRGPIAALPCPHWQSAPTGSTITQRLRSRAPRMPLLLEARARRETMAGVNGPPTAGVASRLTRACLPATRRFRSRPTSAGTSFGRPRRTRWKRRWPSSPEAIMHKHSTRAKP